MEKLKRMESHLPEAMIQRIQYFQSVKEAGRSTILSKSWYTAWLTRPNLDFAEGDFPKLELESPSESAFVKFARKTMQKYDELNRKIQSFRLQMCGTSFHASYLANELIAKAMKLGATELDIELTGSESWIFCDFVLPHEVLESQTLVRLSLVGAKIDLQDRKVSCSRLKSLTLSSVSIRGSNLLDIISMCPLIEKLVLSECNYNSGKYRMLLSKSAGPCVDHPYDFHKLRVLRLEYVTIGEWFFHHISRFPCLKELTFHCCFGHEQVQICSNSIEYISFNTEYSPRILRLRLDVPRIRKFKFSGGPLPSLSFKPISREWEWEWESDISVVEGVRRTSWFNKLREFLLELSPSKIYLSLDVFICSDFLSGCDYAGGIIPTVERMTLKIVNLNDRNEFTKLLCNTLERKVSDDEKQNTSVVPLHGLEEVNIEFFEDDVIARRRRLPSKTLLEASENSGSDKIEVCLRLKWG
ncbi:hypothetical protein ACS0TY_027997 [Phlomoides rotata]